VPFVGELFGTEIHEEDSRNLRKNAHCPFMEAPCDGGGNRDMAQVTLSEDAGVRARFSEKVLGRGFVSCGICTIRTSGTKNIQSKEWIICPRRLLNFGTNGFSPFQHKIIELLCRTAGFRSGNQIGIWSEISLDFKQGEKRFKYRLDYVLRQKLSNTDFGPPVIVEIMTCSTSGGNKRYGTDIKTAFRKAILAAPGEKIKSPNVNIRQVWSRMAGQLIVKSEAAMSWGGKAIWVVQDQLVEYIKQNTGLQVDQLSASVAQEVNIISASSDKRGEPVLLAGPISSAISSDPSFSDILRASFLPSLEQVEKKIPNVPIAEFVVP